MAKSMSGTPQAGQKALATRGIKATSWRSPGCLVCKSLERVQQFPVYPRLALTPAGASNLITSGGADATVQIWDANTGKHLLTFTGHTAGINALAAFSFGPDQSTVAVVSASDDKTVQVWWPDPSLGYATRIYRGHRAKVNAVAILPEVPYYGQRIASASDDQTIQVWEVYRGTPLFTYTGHHAPVKTLASSPV